MKGMAKYLGRTIAAAALLCAGAACTDDPNTADGAAVCTEAEPVRFEVACTPVCTAAQAATRTAPQERTWREGDRIHIYAEFTGKEIAPDDQKQYRCYKYENGDWVPSSASTDMMMWPVGVETGKFTAYYIADLPERISEGMSSGEKLLGDIAEGGDPLRCIAEEVQYGRSVALQFEHLCTHLTLKDVKSDISEGYWLYCKNQGDDEVLQVVQEFPNAYQLKYSSDTGLTFEFCKSDKSRTSDDKNGYYCIERRRNADGTVDFYLAQETAEEGGVKYAYGNCELSYRYNHPYLSFTGVTALDTLQCGHHYELSIEDQLGIVPQPEASFPENPEPHTGRVSIPKLLDGIANGNTVLDDNGNVVLKADDDQTVRLMADIDFNKFNPLEYVKGTGIYATEEVPEDERGAHKDWKLPSVVGRTFDGNYHSFVNVGFPIFDQITNAKIYNLAIRNSTCNITKEQIKEIEEHGMISSDAMKYMTNFGMLGCSINCSITDLLLENVSMTVQLDTSVGGGSSTQTVYNIGCLAGVQNAASSGETTAEIRDVELRGNISVTVDGNLDEAQDCYIGGLVGQAGAKIDGVSCAQSHNGTEGKCKLTVKTDSQNTTYAGGLVGYLTGTACNASLSTVTDCSALKAGQAYVGGLCGAVVNEAATNGMLTDCNASVDVKGAVIVFMNGQTFSHAYTGGISGRIKAVTCRDIAITGTVTGGNDMEQRTDNPDMYDYATGGAYGIIIELESAANTIVERCSARTTVSAAQLVTEGITNWTGNFAGLSKLNEAALTEKNNSASKNNGLPFVGHEGPEPGGGELTDL